MRHSNDRQMAVDGFVLLGHRSGDYGTVTVKPTGNNTDFIHGGGPGGGGRSRKRILQTVGLNVIPVEESVFTLTSAFSSGVTLGS